MADVEALEEAISAAGGEQLLEENISNLIVLPNDSRAIQVFETLQGGSPEIVITRRLLLNEDMASDREILEREPRLTLLLPDVLRVRLLRVNAEVGR